MSTSSPVAAGGPDRLRHLTQAMIVIVAVLVGTIAFLLNRPSGAPAEDPPVRRATDWPLELNGRPPLFKTRQVAARDVPEPPGPGLYLWEDGDGWHLWAVRGPGLEGPTGQLVSDQDFRHAEVNGTEGSGGRATVDGRTIRFDFSEADDRVVGIDFDPAFASTTVILEAAQDGTPLDSAALKLGGRSVAGTLPFQATREQV